MAMDVTHDFLLCDSSSDEMEFEISADQRTGKPIACRVVRLEAGSVSFEVCSLIFNITCLLYL